jgi:hypothetical protein
MLEENDGWAGFVTTPRGRNHAFEMFNYAQRSPNWFAERLTVDDTKVFDSVSLKETLAEYAALYGVDIGQSQFRQEYYCDWTSALLGAFYAREMLAVRDEGRICAVEPDLERAVDYAWDIGVGDDTSIWAFQVCGPQVLILDHIVSHNVGVEYYRDKIFELEKQRGWKHGTDYVPHDAKIKEWGTGRTRVETMSSLGLHPHLVPLATIDDGINAVRRTLPLCVFHPRTEPGGISALEQYQREWDDDKKTFKPTALHNWASHPADAFRYLAQAWRPMPRRAAPEPKPRGWVIPPPPDPKRGGIRL